jgi:hypothetical protein
VDVGADGGFTIRLENVSCDSVALEIDVAPGVARRYHPSLVRMRIVRGASSSERDTSGVSGPQPLRWDIDPPPRDSLRVVLVPTSFTIRGGTYNGTTVPISIDAAMSDSEQRSPFWRVSRTERGYGAPVAWSERAFPLPVVFQPGRRSPSAADTARFWATARRLERDFGQRLFRPGRADTSGGEAGQLVVRIDPGSHAAAMTFVTWDNWGTIHQASIELRSAALLHDERIVSHELMHALGVSHAPWRPSVTGTRYDSLARATAADVAYTQLLYRIRRAHVTGRATHGLLDAVRP